MAVAKKSHKFMSIVLCILILMGRYLSVAYSEEQRENVLVLNSYHQGYKWTDNIVEGVSAVFGAQPQRINLVIEYMDTKQISDEQYLQRLYEIYKYKFNNRKFDIIICSDDTAFHFLRQYGQELFPGTPVVFCGVNYFEDAMLASYPDYTGVVEDFDIRRTIQTALRQCPKTRNIYIVNDKTITGEGIRRAFQGIRSEFPNVKFISLEDMNMTEIQGTVGSLTPDSLVLFMVFFKDVAGNQFSYDESISLIAEKSTAPIFGMWDFYLGHGIVGGMLTSGYQQGKMAAEMAARILSGEKPATIPIVKESPKQYMFDQAQMNRFNISAAELPEDSIIINQTYTNKRQILVLNSYHADMDWVKNIESGINSVFENDKTINIYHDYMDTKRNPSPDYVQKLYEIYKSKYSNKKFDAIVAMDDNAYKFLLAYHKELFANTPIIFGGVNTFEDKDIVGHEALITGVVEDVDIEKTIEVALRLHPDTRQIVVVNDKQSLGQTLRKTFLQEVLPKFKDKVKFVMFEDLNMSEVQERVSYLGSDTIILLLAFTQDKSNNIFSYEESVRLIAKKANVPIYGVWDFYLKHGLIGGMLTSGFSQGETAAHMVKRILDGEDVQKIPIVKKSPNQYMFDYQQLTKFGISPRQLPIGSLIVNEPSSIYEQNKKIIWAVSVFIFLLMSIILMLYVNIRQRKKVEDELKVYATTDQMTGVLNRRTGLLFLQEQLELAKRSSEKFAICFCDVNDLKSVNDSCGHSEGDKLIQAVGTLLRKPLRKSDILCRFGGDEFLIIFPRCDLASAKALAQRMREIIEQYNAVKNHSFSISISFGFAEFQPDSPISIEELIITADNEMYQNKRAYKESRRVENQSK